MNDQNWQLVRELREGEALFKSYPTKDDAEAERRKWSSVFKTEIVLLDTVASEAAKRGLIFAMCPVVRAPRWCIILKKHLRADQFPFGRKRELISGLLALTDPMGRAKGQAVFFEFLIQYLKQNQLIPTHPSPGQSLERYIGEIIRGAAAAFRICQAELAFSLRREYEIVTGRTVPDINGFDTEAYLFRGQVMRLAQRASELLCRVEIELAAEYQSLEQPLRRFIREVWRHGLSELVQKSRLCGLRGDFSRIRLLAWRMPQRTAIQFSQFDSSLSFMVQVSANNNLLLKLNFCAEDLATAAQMIETVICHWPADKAEQVSIFCSDEDVKHITTALNDAHRLAYGALQ